MGLKSLIDITPEPTQCLMHSGELLHWEFLIKTLI